MCAACLSPRLRCPTHTNQNSTVQPPIPLGKLSRTPLKSRSSISSGKGSAPSEFGDTHIWGQFLSASNGVYKGWWWLGTRGGMLAGPPHAHCYSSLQVPSPPSPGWLLLPLGLGFHTPGQTRHHHASVSLSLSPSPSGFLEFPSSCTHASCRIRVTEMMMNPRARKKSAR
jgi:hypothetical protein